MLTSVSATVYTHDMDIEQLCAHYGNQAKAADAIGASRQAFSQWKKKWAEKRKPIPLEYQLKWEKDTNGALKADLPDFVRKPQ